MPHGLLPKWAYDRLLARGDSSDAFLRTYDELLRRLVASGSDLSVCNDILSGLRRQVVRCVGDVKRRTQVEDFLHEARIMTTNAVESVQVGRRMRAWRDSRSLMQAGAAIASARTMDELAKAVHDHLPSAGIPRCFVVCFEEGDSESGLARVALAERPDARKSDRTLSTTYSPANVFREAVLAGTGEHAFATFPATFSDKRRGVVVLELGMVEGYGYEMMRQVFAVALGRMQPC